MRLKGLAVIAMAGLLLAGCSANSGPNETSGALLGGVAGGLVGNAVGRGDGRVATTIVGAALGAVVGANIGRDMDERDREYAYDAADRGLRYNRVEVWTGTRVGYRGRFRPLRSYHRGPRLCRDFVHTVWVRGEPRTYEGTACETRRGRWRVIG
jgi:surface antigen